MYMCLRGWPQGGRPTAPPFDIILKNLRHRLTSPWPLPPSLLPRLFQVLLMDRMASLRQGAIPASGWAYRQKHAKNDPSTHRCVVLPSPFRWGLSPTALPVRSCEPSVM